MLVRATQRAGGVPAAATARTAKSLAVHDIQVAEQARGAVAQVFVFPPRDEARARQQIVGDPLQRLNAGLRQAAPAEGLIEDLSDVDIAASFVLAEAQMPTPATTSQRV